MCDVRGHVIVPPWLKAVRQAEVDNLNLKADLLGKLANKIQNRAEADTQRQTGNLTIIKDG